MNFFRRCIYKTQCEFTNLIKQLTQKENLLNNSINMKSYLDLIILNLNESHHKIYEKSLNSF
jgi:hypothetical protein